MYIQLYYLNLGLFLVCTIGKWNKDQSQIMPVQNSIQQRLKFSDEIFIILASITLILIRMIEFKIKTKGNFEKMQFTHFKYQNIALFWRFLPLFPSLTSMLWKNDIFELESSQFVFGYFKHIQTRFEKRPLPNAIYFLHFI